MANLNKKLSLKERAAVEYDKFTRRANRSEWAELIAYIVAILSLTAIILGFFATVIYFWGCLLLWVPNTLFDAGFDYTWKNSTAAWLLFAIVSAIFSRAK